MSFSSPAGAGEGEEGAQNQDDLMTGFKVADFEMVEAQDEEAAEKAAAAEAEAKAAADAAAMAPAADFWGQLLAGEAEALHVSDCLIRSAISLKFACFRR